MAEATETATTSNWFSLGDVGKDFVAGTIGGMAGVVIGQPFDVIKVALQTQPLSGARLYTGTFSCLTTILRKEGVFGFYRGMASPMVGVAGINALLFGVYGNLIRWLDEDPDGRPSLVSCGIAGSVSGFVNSFVSSPMELIKTRMQTQPSNMKDRLYHGALDCIKKTIKIEGVKGLYRGMVPTVVREIPSYAAYFVTYEFSCRALTPDGESVDELSPLALLLAGGLGGIAAWVSTYPADVIKSRLQAQHVGQEWLTVRGVMREYYRAEGSRAFFKGLCASILRAFPVNAATLSVYTLSMRFLNNLNADEFD
eukprot:Colp12_sorted_trinity150504_noHs@29679